MNYWTECISEALDEAGLSATEEQIKLIVEHVEGAHENYSLATGLDVADSNFISDAERKSQMLEECHEKNL